MQLAQKIETALQIVSQIKFYLIKCNRIHKEYALVAEWLLKQRRHTIRAESTTEQGDNHNSQVLWCFLKGEKMELKEDNLIKVPNYQNCFIYFLVKDKNVVYVGQTAKGIVRPFMHKDKIFNEIYIKYCKKEDLDKLEDMFIMKYRPIYNKNCNRVMRYGFTRVKHLIKKETDKKDFNLWDLKKIMKELNIEPQLIYNVPTVSVFEFYDILNFVKENM